MTVWSELVSVALVGTERKSSPALVGEVAALVGADLAGQGTEQAFLTAAGVLAAYRRAGLPVLHADHPPPQPTAPDDRPEAPASATQTLELVLSEHVTVLGGPVPLAAFWLERCAAAGHRPPPRLLPALLDLGTREPPMREATMEAGGPLLAWLAGRNPRWSWAAGVAEEDGDPHRTWETGDQQARLALLRRLRSSDPARARELVRDCWSGEKAGDRAKIVETFAIGLGPEDEPFLEAALDDRAKTVRAVAAQRLAAVPSSGLAARMADRLRPLVAASGRFRKKLEVALPDEPDAAARRDGIVDDGAPAGAGLRAWWLIQLVAAAPLRFWEEQLGLPPAEIITLSSQAELRHGWSIAAIRQRQVPWATELLHARKGGYSAALLSVLPPNQARDTLADLLRTCSDATLPMVLGGVPGPWSRSLTQAVLDRLRATKNLQVVRSALPSLSAADPSMGAAVDGFLADLADKGHFRHEVRQLAHTLSIRRTITEAFR
ncbi:MAG: DUF5691 domain-containing protein [Actinomycetota bacterium]|nr:DUF5691 domain-containing protein [Actinomycetota bacterium]